MFSAAFIVLAASGEALPRRHRDRHRGHLRALHQHTSRRAVRRLRKDRDKHPARRPCRSIAACAHHLRAHRAVAGRTNGQALRHQRRSRLQDPVQKVHEQCAAGAVSVAENWDTAPRGRGRDRPSQARSCPGGKIPAQRCKRQVPTLRAGPRGCVHSCAE